MRVFLVCATVVITLNFHLICRAMATGPERCSFILLRPNIDRALSLRAEILASVHRNYGADDILIANILHPLASSDGIEAPEIRRLYLQVLLANTNYYLKTDAIMAAHLTLGRYRAKLEDDTIQVRELQISIRDKIRSGQRDLDNQVTALLVKGWLQKKQVVPASQALEIFRDMQMRLLTNPRIENGVNTNPNMDNFIIAAHLTNAVLISGKNSEQVFQNFNALLDHSPMRSTDHWASETAAILTGAFAQTSMSVQRFASLFQDVRLGATQDRTHSDDFQAAYLIYSVLGL